MKKLVIFPTLLSIILLITFLVSGCGVILVPKDGETEPGDIETRQYDFTEFTRVDIGSAFKYEIQQADTYSISITANSNLFDDIKVNKAGQTLAIGIDYPGAAVTIFNFSPSLKAIITMPELKGLDSSGATHGTVTGFSSNDNLDVTASGASTVELEDMGAGDTDFDLSGASTVKGAIEVEDLAIDMSGASTVKLSGSADSLAVDGSGASHLKLADFLVGNADVTLSGASDATVNLAGTLDVDLSGASTLEYIGKPTLGIMDISGASAVKKK